MQVNQEKIPQGWKETTLAEVADFSNGRTSPKRSNYGRYEVFGSNGVIGLSDETNFEENTIIIGRVGSYCGSLYFSKNKCWVTDNAISSRSKSNSNPIFLYYLLLTLNLNSRATGSGQPLINQSILNSIEVKVPVFPDEQEAIADVLSSFDDKIELLRRQNKTLEKIAQTIFKEWFVKFAVNGKKLRIDNSTGLPDGWRIGKLGEYLSVSIGGDWGKETKIKSDDVQAYCLRGTDIDSLKMTGYSAQVPIRWIKKDSLEKRTITENDILIGGSGLGPIGKTLYRHPNINLLYEFPITYSNFCKRLTAKNKYYALYFEYLLSKLYKQGALERFFIGTSIPNLDMNGLLEEKVVIPDEKQIEDFAKIVDFKYSKLINPQIQTLSKLRNTLLPKLMKGEIRVKS